MIRTRYQGLRDTRAFFSEERKALFKRIRAQVREVANLIRKDAVAAVKSTFGAGKSERRYLYGGARTKGPGLLASAIRVKVKVDRNYIANAWIGVSAKKSLFPVALYAPALERGGTITRRPGKSRYTQPNRVRTVKERKAHTARYTARPWFYPQVARHEATAEARLGRVFREP